jgi:hypothetical protein
VVALIHPIVRLMETLRLWRVSENQALALPILLIMPRHRTIITNATSPTGACCLPANPSLIAAPPTLNLPAEQEGAAAHSYRAITQSCLVAVARWLAAIACDSGGRPQVRRLMPAIFEVVHRAKPANPWHFQVHGRVQVTGRHDHPFIHHHDDGRQQNRGKASRHDAGESWSRRIG